MNRTVLATLVIFLLSNGAEAQDLANIVGTVTDPSGAAVPDARIAISNPAKGFQREVVSRADGEYTAARIPMGDYVITCEATGFEKLTHTGITLDAGQTQRVDLKLALGL